MAQFDTVDSSTVSKQTSSTTDKQDVAFNPGGNSINFNLVFVFVVVFVDSVVPDDDDDDESVVVVLVVDFIAVLPSTVVISVSVIFVDVLLVLFCCGINAIITLLRIEYKLNILCLYFS